MNAFISNLLNNTDERAEKIFERFKLIKLKNIDVYNLHYKIYEEQLLCAYSIGKICNHEKKECSSRIMDILDICEFLTIECFETIVELEYN